MCRWRLGKFPAWMRLPGRRSGGSGLRAGKKGERDVSKHSRGKAALLFGMLAAGVGTAFAATFVFSFVAGYGSGGLSQPFAGTTSTGHSYARASDISQSDTNQAVYSLVQANPDGGSGYQGPYYMV